MKSSPRLLLLTATLVTTAHGAITSGLANLSTRGQTGAGVNILTAGFAINSGPARTVLLRAVGPGLQQFSVPGFATDPVLTLYNTATPNTPLASNDNWSAADAPTAAAVGAFALTVGSRDAVLVRTLPPGNYTAQVSNNGAGNIVLVEVYDTSTGSSGLFNISTRAQVGSGAGVLTPGLVIAPGNTRRMLLRAAGPGLAPFPGVTGTISDPALSLINNITKVTMASNDNWDASGDSSALTAAFAQAGAFSFTPGSKDAALVAELPPGLYTLQVTGVNGATGLALVEAYDLTPANAATVTLATIDAQADETGTNPAAFRVTRTGDTSAPLTVYYSPGGSATHGVDYALLPGSVTIPAGASSADITINPLPDVDNESSETISLTLTSSVAYAIGGAVSASATITSNAGTLYVASLRPESSAANSTASGSATIVLSASGSVAKVTVSFSNLSSTETTAYLRLGPPGADGAYILALPQGQVSGAYWSIQPSGAYSANDIVNAIKTGLIYLSVPTANYPAGELRGTFIQSSGAANFTPPAAPPALADAPMTAGEAARFLTQATFGPIQADIDSLTGKRLADLNNWIATQMAKPATLHRAATMADFAANNAGGQNAVNGVNTRPGGVHRQATWWKTALAGDDQLRQRVAFALSEILVISDDNGTINAWQEGAANYYDILVRNAFGSFRQLIEEVTLSPMMGIYLSHLRNAKAVNNALPDENYAREVMQLFTIGLNQLNPDGTLKLDAAGLPIPTYDQTTITETAKVFTGWAFFQTSANPNFRGGGNLASQYVTPMMLYPAFHEDAVKTIVGGVQIPAGQGGVQDLTITLDTLFNHANTPVFISRQLIQRLVTSNPGPGYVYRVAQVFENNGSGGRGDLGAVVRAILTDYEARSAVVAGNPGFGHLKEPLLRTTALLRAFNGAANSGRLSNLNNADGQLAQASLSAPTVFNFFEPYYVQPGPLAAAGLYAPEYQILTDTTAITVPNYLYGFIYANRPTDAASNTVYLQLDSLLPNARNTAALLDQFSVFFCNGAMPTAMRDRIITALDAFASNTTDLERVRSALYLTVATAEGAVQK